MVFFSSFSLVIALIVVYLCGARSRTLLIGLFLVNCCIYGPCPSRRVSFIVGERKALDLMKVKRVGARDCDLQS